MLACRVHTPSIALVMSLDSSGLTVSALQATPHRVMCSHYFTSLCFMRHRNRTTCSAGHTPPGSPLVLVMSLCLLRLDFPGYRLQGN